MTLLAYKPACDLPVSDEQQRWLIRDVSGGERLRRLPAAQSSP
jgi:hypothetical protein